MASGSFSSGGQLSAEIDWSSSQNGPNSSWVDAKFYIVCAYRMAWFAKKYGSITINGSVYGFSYNGGDFPGDSKILIAEYGVTVNHNSAGNASINISGALDIKITYDVDSPDPYWVESLSTGGTAALDSLAKTTPGVPEWGPLVSKYIANPGDPLTISWGGGGGFGRSGSDAASFAYCEVQWNYNNTSWGELWTGAAFSMNTNMPNLQRGWVLQLRVRVFNNFGLASNWAYTSYIICNVLPVAPVSVTGSPVNFEPGSSIAFTAIGANGGSYLIGTYHFQTSSDGGITWTDLDPIHTTNSIISSAFITRGQSIQARVSITNTGGYISDWTYSNVLQVNNAPTAPASIAVPSLVYLSNPNVYFACSGATPGAGNITEYNFDIQDIAGAGWLTVYQGPAPGCTVNLSNFLTLTPEQILQVRVRIKNSYGTYSNYLISNNITVQGGIAHIKENGIWKTGIVYVRVAGIWEQAVSVYVKESGVWRQGL